MLNTGFLFASGLLLSKDGCGLALFGDGSGILTRDDVPTDGVGAIVLKGFGAAIGFLTGKGIPPDLGFLAGSGIPPLGVEGVERVAAEGLLSGGPDVFDNTLTPVLAIC